MPKWIGPFTVDHMVGPAAVRLNLPSDMRIHPTFHVSLIKKYVPDPEKPAPTAVIPAGLDLDGIPIWFVDHVVTHREIKRRVGHKYSRRYRTLYEYKVRWANCPESADTWQKPSDFSDNGASILAYWQTLNQTPPEGALPKTELVARS